MSQDLDEPDYVWFNSKGGLVDGMVPGTSDLLINTGIRVYHLFRQPFIHAGSWPEMNHKGDLGHIALPLPPGMLLTTIATSIPHSTFVWLAGESLTTEIAVVSDIPMVVSETPPAAPTVQFSFNPLSSTPSPTATL